MKWCKDDGFVIVRNSSEICIRKRIPEYKKGAEKVEEYLGQFQVAISAGDIAACIRIARAGVKEFPNHYGLLNKLMYALFLAGDEDGNIPDWKKIWKNMTRRSPT